jgi:site-specific recombinase XerD
LLPLTELADSWLTDLRAARKSDHTIRAYSDSWNAYTTFCTANTRPLVLDKPTVQAFIINTTDTRSPSTASLRLAALKAFARWLAVEEGFDADPVRSVTAPKLDQKVVDHLSDTALRALLAACNGSGFRDTRDKAMVALFAETGLRSAEMLALGTDDISISECTAIVRKGKGGKGRRVKFSAQTASLLDRYLRARRRTGVPPGGPLWRSSRGPLSYPGMTLALQNRAQSAGIADFHPHRLRHTAAVRWLAARGSEGGLMAQAGWRSRAMLDRYVQSAREDLAAEEFDRLGIGLDPD